MVYICESCKINKCNSCENKAKCDCKCNLNRALDVTQKVLATIAGAGMAAGGLALTILSGGLAIPIGGALMGAGISSAYQGINKSVKQERIDVSEYLIDVSFGALTGVFTGGIGAAGEVVASTVAKQGAKEVTKQAAKQLCVRAVAGGVAGVASKAVDEVKQCATTEKKLSEFGKDNNTSVSWILSAGTGVLGG